jgi:hypothetical protein
LPQQLVDLTFVSHEHDFVLRVFARKEDGSLDDFAGGMIPAHGIEGEAHGFLLDCDDLSAGVVAAASASAMREHGLLALRALVDLHRGADLVVRCPAPVAAHLRRSLLGDAHRFL